MKEYYPSTFEMDRKIRELESLNAELLAALKGVLGWYEQGNHKVPAAIISTAHVTIAKAEDATRTG